MSATLTLQRSQMNFPWKIAGILILLAAAVVLDMHAIEKHGEDAVLVRQCLDQGGPVMSWQKDNRIILCVQLPDGRFGIQVQEKGREVTSYIKNKMTRITQIKQYLRNTGAKPLP